MKFQTHINAALICMGLILAGIVQAAVPQKINYQGVLKDDNGVKVDGTVDIDLNLLPLGGGAAVFSESHTGVSVVGGLFSLKIGAVNDLSAVSFDAAYELELTVGGELMSPNVPLCSAPYALGVAGGAQGPQGKVGPAGADGAQGDAGPVGSEFWDGSGNDIHSTNSGNVGIGGQSQTIHSAAVNISLGGNATISGDRAPSTGAVLDIAQNVYFNTNAAWTKMSNDESSRYQQAGGVHSFYTAPSGTGAAAESLIMSLQPGAGAFVDVLPIAQVTARAGTVEAHLVADDTTGFSNLNFTYSMSMHQTGYGTPRLRIENGGNVGIGILSPTHKLDVDGDINCAGQYLINGTPLDLGGGGGAWEDNGTNVWRTGGKVGIGTDSPAARLHVKDSTTAIRIETEGSWAYTEYVDSGATKYSMGYRAAGGEHFWLGTTDIMTGAKFLMRSDGDVYLGGSIVGSGTGNGILVKNNGEVQFYSPNSGFINGSLHVGTPLVTAVTVGGSVSAAGFITTSDERCKENIQTVSSALEKVTQLRGVNFNWREDVAAEFEDMNADELQLGLVAQEVEEVVPEVVFTSIGGYKGVSYQSLTGLLVEAIKEQRQEYQSQIDALRTEVEGLKAAN